jgi:hypothetical protein
MWHLTERDENRHDGSRTRYRNAAITRSSFNTNITASLQHHPLAFQPDLSPEFSAAHVAQNTVHLQLTIRCDKTSTTHLSAADGHARRAQHHNSCQKTACYIRTALSQSCNTTAVKSRLNTSVPHSYRTAVQQLSTSTAQRIRTLTTVN